jgi:glycosyltransferase involved in cell wall biosynthesis
MPAVAVTPPAYTALIRTHRCDALLERTVQSLREQGIAPREIVFVDSSRDPACTAALRALGGRIVAYPDGPFNFSKALNLGVAAASQPWVLLISSHVVLAHPSMIETGWAEAEAAGAQGLYWIASLDGRLALQCIAADAFDGHNGLSNACALLPATLMRERPFREEVFAAEDQEWAAWFFRTHRGRMLRITHPALKYLNPNANELKKINEEIAIAYYAYPRNRRLDRILLRCARGLLALWRRRPRAAHMHWEIAKGLFMANFRRPSRASRYFE